jgi:hypothetical protein
MSERRPEKPDPDLPQDPGIPGGAPPPKPEQDGPSLEEPDSPEDPPGIDAPGSRMKPPPSH